MYYEKVYSGDIGLEGYKATYFRRFRRFRIYSGYRNFMESGVKVVYKQESDKYFCERGVKKSFYQVYYKMKLCQ